MTEFSAKRHLRRATGRRLDALARLLFSPRCRLCGDRAATRLDLCPACQRDLPWLGSACPLCTRPLPEHSTTPCGGCLRHPPVLTRAHAAFRYDGAIAALIQRFKFDGDLAAGRLLSQLLAAAMHDRALPGTLLPVPLHRRRLRERGFNQAAELARRLPGRLLHDRVRRVRATPPQSRLGARARRRSPGAAFAITGRPLPDAVTIVDDVITTGATADSLARCLARAGVGEIHLVCLASANER